MPVNSKPPLRSRLRAIKLAGARAQVRSEWAWEHAHEVYAERDLLVRALSCLWPAHLMPRKGHQPRDRVVWTVCIHAPTGQMAWTVPEAMLPSYDHLERTQNHWDGHRTVDRIARLEAITPVESPQKPALGDEEVPYA